MTYTFIAAIAGNHLNDAYSQWTVRKLADYGFSTANGDLKLNDSLVGFCKFVDREAGRDLLPEGARRLVDDPGPYSGPIAGYFQWTHTVDESAAERLVPAMLAISRSVIARTDNGEFRAVVRQIEFPLTDLLGKFGFHDGDALLSRDDDYLAYVVGAVEAAVEAAGYAAHIGRYDGIHNPIRLAGDLEQSGKVIDDPSTALEGHSVKIWALDLEIVNDREFWRD
ncbi:MAG TPA: hypothetical protein VFP84_22960 [Kofleriaceae bacterium]|nr:hypothetical protein [Kofleriaceae bacterium]